MPNAESPVVAAERRAWNYWFIDGLPNLVAGLACLVLSSTFIILMHYRHTRPLMIGLAILGIVIWGAVYIRLRQTLEWLKTRITYPRTGFAAPPYFTDDPKPTSDLAMLNLSTATEKETIRELLLSEDTRRRLWFMFGIFLAAAIVGAFIPSRLLCAAGGLITGAMIWLAARKDPRKSWSAVFGLFFAQMIFTFNFGTSTPRVERAGFFMAGVGFALALTGTIALVRYLLRNPARQA